MTATIVPKTSIPAQPPGPCVPIVAHVNPFFAPQSLTSIDYMHKYRGTYGRYPKVGLFCGDPDMDSPTCNALVGRIANALPPRPDTPHSPSSSQTVVAEDSAYSSDTLRYTPPTEDEDIVTPVTSPVSNGRSHFHDDLFDVDMADPESESDDSDGNDPSTSDSEYQDSDHTPPSKHRRGSDYRARRAPQANRKVSLKTPTKTSTGISKRTPSSSSPSSLPVKHRRKVKTSSSTSSQISTSTSERGTSVSVSEESLKDDSDCTSESRYAPYIFNGKTRFKCLLCPDFSTAAAGDMNRHLESQIHQEKSYFCACGKSYTRRDALMRHIQKVHSKEKYKMVDDGSGKRMIWK